MAKRTAKDRPKATRSNNRLEAVLEAAAKLFAIKGYKATTMRDIAAETGMQAGSLYYHFASKQELLLEIYRHAVGGIQRRMDEAIEALDDPWERFEAAIVRHVETILDQSNYAKVMVGVVPDDAAEIKRKLARLRDGYENRFTELIEDLPLSKDVDRKLFRLMVIGALNSTQLWYREGAYTPTEIGRQFTQMLRVPHR